MAFSISAAGPLDGLPNLIAIENRRLSWDWGVGAAGCASAPETVTTDPISAATDTVKKGLFIRSKNTLIQPMENIPLLIDFAAPTSLLRESDRPSALPILGNGPPGTFVLFPGGLRVSLPTDQIVFADDTGGHARVGFGGMRFVGSEEGRLAFVRVRELIPEDQLSPARSHKMLLDTQWVATISVDGQPVWPGGESSRSA